MPVARTRFGRLRPAEPSTRSRDAAKEERSILRGDPRLKVRWPPRPGICRPRLRVVLPWTPILVLPAAMCRPVLRLRLGIVRWINLVDEPVGYVDGEQSPVCGVRFIHRQAV